MQKCSASVVAVVFQNALGMSTVGVVTDLTSTDVLKFREHENVNSDDVLNADRLRKRSMIWQRFWLAYRDIKIECMEKYILQAKTRDSGRTI